MFIYLATELANFTHTTSKGIKTIFIQCNIEKYTTENVLFNRDIIGWSLGSNMTRKETILAAITKLVGSKQMRNRIFEYIEILYGKQRSYSYLGYQTMEEFNSQYLKQNVKEVA